MGGCAGQRTESVRPCRKDSPRALTFDLSQVDGLFPAHIAMCGQEPEACHTARVACLVPITLGIIAAFGVNRQGAFAGMLMITTVQTASIWNVGIKTAAAQNMVTIGFIEKAFGRTITWLEWLIAAAPFGILMSIAALFRDDPHDAAGTRASYRRAQSDPQIARRPWLDEDRREEALGDFAYAAGILVDRRRAAHARHQHHDDHRRRRSCSCRASES
jgi:hypothetical protein